jgi:hypothetical protein
MIFTSKKSSFKGSHKVKQHFTETNGLHSQKLYNDKNVIIPNLKCVDKIVKEEDRNLIKPINDISNEFNNNRQKMSHFNTCGSRGC